MLDNGELIGTIWRKRSPLGHIKDARSQLGARCISLNGIKMACPDASSYIGEAITAVDRPELARAVDACRKYKARAHGSKK